jgi:hypothetical protein
MTWPRPGSAGFGDQGGRSGQTEQLSVQPLLSGLRRELRLRPEGLQVLVQETLRRGLSGRHVQRGERQSDPGRGGSGEDRQGCVYGQKGVLTPEPHPP